MRLQFESAELVFINVADAIETFDGLAQILQLYVPGSPTSPWQIYEYPFVTGKASPK